MLWYCANAYVAPRALQTSATCHERFTVRLTPQFSGGALTKVPWHFIHDRPLQLLVRRIDRTAAARQVSRRHLALLGRLITSSTFS